MDVVGGMAAYLPVVHVCTAQSREALSAPQDCAVHTLTMDKYVAITLTTSISTDMKKTITVILAKYCIELPDGGSLVIRNVLEQF